MEFTVYLDGNPTIREEGFFEAKVAKLQEQVTLLESNCAELVKTNEEISERCKELATRTPQWPKGYRPRRYKNNNQTNQGGNQRKFNGR